MTISLNLLLSIEKDLAPKMQIAARRSLRPVSDKSIDCFRQSSVPERLCQELAKAGFVAPIDKALLLHH